MSVVCVPEMEPEGQEWPSLGPQVVQWIETELVFGPGDLRGKRAEVDPEKRALLTRAYEVYPRTHERAGRRRFKRVCWSLRKGSAKTECAAWVAAAEIHPRAPVRTVSWDERRCLMHGRKRARGACLCVPIGGGVRDPYIPLIAYTEEQSEELCYGALLTILGLSKVEKDFDLGLERIMRKRGDGKVVAVSTAPGPRDGARTTFQHADETHRFVLPRLVKAWDTMLANQPKRKLSDAWSLETTTAYAPGENSVAERTRRYADSVAAGRTKDSRLFFFHREAGETDPATGKAYDLAEPESLRRAVLEASGAVSAWSDIDAIVEQFADPSRDRTFLERVWLNRITKASERAFDVRRWAELARPEHIVPAGALITIGFDGSRYDDAAGLVGTEVETGFQFPLGKWERPPDAAEDWQVAESDVNAAVAEAFERYEVCLMYADPPHWYEVVGKWSGEYGEKRVVEYQTNRWRKTAEAVRAFWTAIRDGSLTHSGDPDVARHVANAHRVPISQKDDDGQPLFIIAKERRGSPLKMDHAMAAVLSWQARLDAIAAGAKPMAPRSFEVAWLE